MKEQVSLESLTSLIAFARAGSLGSFTAAARSLSISPSAVSKSIGRLEQRLGVSLFTRTTRALTLTPEGRELHDRALDLIQAAEEIERAAVDAQAKPTGTLRISAAVMIGVHVIAPALPAFRKLCPEVTIDLRVGNEIVDLVEQGIDVAIRIGEVADSRLLSRKLMECQVTAFASPGYLAARGTPAHPDELDGHDIVNLRYQNSGKPFRWPFRIDGRIVEIVPKAGILVDLSDALVTVIEGGGGIGVTDAVLAARHVARGALVPILTDFAVKQHDVTALWPANRNTNPAVRTFLDWLPTAFRDHQAGSS